MGDTWVSDLLRGEERLRARPAQSIPQGWQCPVCGRVMAPGMPNCTRCPAAIETITPPRTDTPLPPASQTTEADWRSVSPILREASNGCYCDACCEADERKGKCPRCGGAGGLLPYEPGSYNITCPDCRGTGRLGRTL